MMSDVRPVQIDPLAWGRALRAAVRARLDQAPDRAADEGLVEVPGDAVDDILEHVVQGATGLTGPSAVRVVSRLRLAGISAEAAKAVASVLFSDPRLIHKWHDWQEVADRDEIRMRLEILARCDQISDDLAPFLTFFFRASVSDLFRPAAIALGRHSLYRAEMMASLRLFARQRQIDLSSPIVLNGQRSRRRALLALSGAVASPGATPELLAEAGLAGAPLCIERRPDEAPRVHLGADGRDLISVIGALDLLIDAGRGGDELPELGVALLLDIVQRPTRSLSRHTIQRAGSLLSTIAARSDNSSQAIDGWTNLIRVQMREIDTDAPVPLAQRMGQLVRLDEMVRAVMFLPAEIAGGLPDNVLPATDTVSAELVRERLRTWAAREHTAASSVTLPATEPLRAGASEGRSHEGFRRPSDMIAAADHGQTDGDGQVWCLRQYLSITRRADDWKSCSTMTQGLALFYTLDAVSHPVAPQRQLAALFEPSVRRTDLGEPPTAQALAGRMLMRLLAWEEEGTEAFIDNRLLNQLDDDDVLLGLVPSHASPLIPDLADAIEHRLRLHLQREMHFGVMAWLHRLAVRRPHGSLLRQLRELSQGRHYSRPSGEAVHLAETIGWFEAYLDGAELPTPHTQSQEDIGFVRQRDRVRARLREAAELTHADELLIALISATGSPEDQSHALRRSTVVRLLRSIHPAEQPVVRGAYPAWAQQTIDELCAEIAGLLREIDRARAELLPERWSEVDAMLPAASSILTRLGRLRAVVAPLLPAPESTLFEAAVDAAVRAIESWLSALGSLPPGVLEVDLDPITSESTHDVHEATSLLSGVASLPIPALRERLMMVAWEGLRRQTGTPVAASGGTSEEPSKTDSWADEYALLIAAVGAVTLDESSKEIPWSVAERQRWKSALAWAWVELAHRAMADRDEERVIDLIAREDFAPLRTTPKAVDTLGQLRNWCLDHHLLSPAHRAASDRALAQGRPTPGRMAGIGAWLGRFMVIWFALLIGSILMLDFGDGWRAMAEEQDVRGILLTALIGLAGSYGYLFLNLRQRIVWRNGTRWGSLFRRVTGFFGVCVVYTTLIVTFMWWLLSRTDEVVHGAWAVGHIVVWSGFALFIGVFFGLISKNY